MLAYRVREHHKTSQTIKVFVCLYIINVRRSSYLSTDMQHTPNPQCPWVLAVDSVV